MHLPRMQTQEEQRATLELDPLRCDSIPCFVEELGRLLSGISMRPIDDRETRQMRQGLHISMAFDIHDLAGQEVDPRSS